MVLHPQPRIPEGFGPPGELEDHVAANVAAELGQTEPDTGHGDPTTYSVTRRPAEMPRRKRSESS